MDQPRLSQKIAQSEELEAAMLNRLISEPTAALEVTPLSVFLVGFEPSQTLIYSLTPKELTPLPQEWSLFE